MTLVTPVRVTDVTRVFVTGDTHGMCSRDEDASMRCALMGHERMGGEVTIVAEKKISPKAPEATAKKESGKTEAATRVSRVKRLKRQKRMKRVKK